MAKKGKGKGKGKGGGKGEYYESAEDWRRCTLGQQKIDVAFAANNGARERLSLAVVDVARVLATKPTEQR